MTRTNPKTSMKTHNLILLTFALLLTACSSPMTMPNGLPLPD